MKKKWMNICFVALICEHTRFGTRNGKLHRCRSLFMKSLDEFISVSGVESTPPEEIVSGSFILSLRNIFYGLIMICLSAKSTGRLQIIAIPSLFSGVPVFFWVVSTIQLVIKCNTWLFRIGVSRWGFLFRYSLIWCWTWPSYLSLLLLSAVS